MVCTQRQEVLACTVEFTAVTRLRPSPFPAPTLLSTAMRICSRPPPPSSGRYCLRVTNPPSNTLLIAGVCSFLYALQPRYSPLPGLRGYEKLNILWTSLVHLLTRRHKAESLLGSRWRMSPLLSPYDPESHSRPPRVGHVRLTLTGDTAHSADSHCTSEGQTLSMNELVLKV